MLTFRLAASSWWKFFQYSFYSFLVLCLREPWLRIKGKMLQCNAVCEVPGIVEWHNSGKQKQVAYRISSKEPWAWGEFSDRIWFPKNLVFRRLSCKASSVYPPYWFCTLRNRNSLWFCFSYKVPHLPLPYYGYTLHWVLVTLATSSPCALRLDLYYEQMCPAKENGQTSMLNWEVGTRNYLR